MSLSQKLVVAQPGDHHSVVEAQVSGGPTLYQIGKALGKEGAQSQIIADAPSK